MVDVEHRDREAPARAARAGELGQGALLESGAVQEAGQRVRGGAREEAPLLLGDAREKERREENEPGAERRNEGRRDEDLPPGGELGESREDEHAGRGEQKRARSPAAAREVREERGGHEREGHGEAGLDPVGARDASKRNGAPRNAATPSASAA